MDTFLSWMVPIVVWTLLGVSAFMAGMRYQRKVINSSNETVEKLNDKVKHEEGYSFYLYHLTSIDDIFYALNTLVNGDERIVNTHTSDVSFIVLYELYYQLIMNYLTNNTKLNIYTINTIAYRIEYHQYLLKGMLVNERIYGQHELVNINDENVNVYNLLDDIIHLYYQTKESKFKRESDKYMSDTLLINNHSYIQVYHLLKEKL